MNPAMRPAGLCGEARGRATAVGVPLPLTAALVAASTLAKLASIVVDCFISGLLVATSVDLLLFQPRSGE